MIPEKNIFGIKGTWSENIVNHFNDMKLEIVKAYEYHAISDIQLGLILSNINDLEKQLSHVCTKINMEREHIENILIDNNIIE